MFTVIIRITHEALTHTPQSALPAFVDNYVEPRQPTTRYDVWSYNTQDKMGDGTIRTSITA